MAVPSKQWRKIYAHSEVCLKPAEALNMNRENREGNVYECEAAHDFLELLIFLSHSLKRSNQHLSGHRSNIFFKINSSKMTYSHLRNKFINWSSIINQKSRGQSQQRWGTTYKPGHTSKWNTDPTEPQRSLGTHWMESRFYWLWLPWTLRFTESHLDRPKCLCQLSFCRQNHHL